MRVFLHCGQEKVTLLLLEINAFCIMTILDRRSNAQPAVPGSVTGDRDTIFGRFF
jgi:hypothetical protein